MGLLKGVLYGEYNDKIKNRILMNSFNEKVVCGNILVNITYIYQVLECKTQK